MFSRGIGRVLKYGIYGGAIVGTVVAINKDEFEVDSNALVRLTRTAITAVEIGLVYKTMLKRRKLLEEDSDEYLAVRSEAHKKGAEKLLELCKTNKGVYIKVGQHVGALDYLLPSEYVQTMKILHKDAPKNKVEELYTVIEQDLKMNPKELFSEFDPEPLGTASLAQVHRAKLKNGQEVAVKVQHSFVRKNIDMDLKWMEFVINTMSKVFPEFEMQWLVDETKKNIRKELNFLEEGKNAEKCAEMFKDRKWLKVPKIYWDYCTERVLVMDYITGGQVNDVAYIKEHNIDPQEICKKLGDLYSHMIFVNGFVHSDPHPGNIVLKKDPEDKETTIYMLDHGLYAELTDKFRYHYSKLWLAILSKNKEEMKIHSQHLGIKGDLYILFACMVSGRPWESIMKGIATTKPSSKEKKIFQNELPHFMHYVTQCLENVDRQALLVLKTNDLIRSIEYALQMQEKMTGFLVMAQCCTKSIYGQEIQNSNSTMRRQYLRVKRAWTTFLIKIYGVYLSLYHDYLSRWGLTQSTL